jgi:hypothetical protein
MQIRSIVIEKLPSHYQMDINGLRCPIRDFPLHFRRALRREQQEASHN